MDSSNEFLRKYNLLSSFQHSSEDDNVFLLKNNHIVKKRPRFKFSTKGRAPVLDRNGEGACITVRRLLPLYKPTIPDQSFPMTLPDGETKYVSTRVR